MSAGFERKVAIVTGAARGIGKEIARQLTGTGAKVAVVDIDADSAQSAAAEMGAASFVCDVSNARSVAEMTASVVAQLGPIAILVNNAGICERVHLEELSEQQWERTLAVNLKGPFLLSQAALPHMKARRWGRIINIASVAGKIGGLMVGLHYTASKGGLLALTRGMARELAPHNITVNSVCPAMADTEIGRLFSDEEKQRYLAGVPLGRLAQPADVAAAVMYLASEAASYVTGEVIDVNGGIVMD